ncbi:unnamed protein product [Ilex paraguariensis]|uniref:Uncharacterized protein n=1 Tax=Ilex paraguariensis TaxID=185542 RepID=A0ABC8QSQ2_9AQUA
MASSQSLTLISKCTIFPDQKSILSDLKLSVSDLPMLSYHYIQKGGLFTHPPVPIDSLISLLQCGLSQTLSLFPPIAGRLKTDSSGYVYITSNDAGVDFIHASAIHIHVRDILSPTDVPNCVKEFFAFDRTPSYDGHFKPILVVQVIELADGVFIGCALNHAVTDGTSFWNFFNILWRFVELVRGIFRGYQTSGMNRMAVNCRHWFEPKLDSYYFGNAIQSIPAYASAATFCHVISDGASSN